MGYQEIIKKVQIYSGLSDGESKDALDCLVETLAVRLDEAGRKQFATNLPEELGDMALAVYPSEENSKPDILVQFMQLQQVSPTRARRDFLSAWQALKDSVNGNEIKRLRQQLPRLNQLLR
jgi:uncharacterized protein (DUF2267 family)